MEKLDLRQQLKHLYQPPAKEVTQVDVPALNYLMLDGSGDPNTSQAYRDGVQVLFNLSYTLKFMVKKGVLAIDYSVLPLEGLWWAEDMSTFLTADKSRWQWTMLMMQPDFITPAMVAEAIQAVKRKSDPPLLKAVRLETLSEGLCAQIMHVGPFSAEGPTIERLHQYIADAGYQRRGKHHEIYLSDIRKAAPEKWRTVIRQPMG
jgi:hypothetical protein